MSEYFVGTTGSNSQTTFEALTTSEVLDDLGLNTGDAPTFSGLFLDGSGSTIFSVDGSNGRLFGVTDEVTGTVFSVNDAAGLPIVEVESTADFDKITLGEYGSDLLVLSGQTTAEVTGSQIATQSWINDQGFSENYYLTGVSKSGNTFTFEVNGASDPTYTLTSGDITGALGYTPVTLEDDGSIEAEEFIGDLRGAVSFKAQAGEAIAKGEAVFISGISGNTTVVGLADANDATRMPAFGIASEAASANNPVTVINFGSLGSLDTDTPNWDEGDELFVSNTAGELTTTPPTSESSLLQKIAKVTRRHASSGSITVMGAGRSNAVPNLNEGRLFVGNSSNEAVADDTAYVDIANSRVGIGTTSPTDTLDVNGGIRLSTSGTIQGRSYPYTTNIGSGANATTTNITAGSTDKSEISLVGGDVGDRIEFKTNSTERMRIDASGNVGIGTTSPAGVLEVAGNTDTNSNFLVIRDKDPTAGSARPSIRFAKLDGTVLGQLLALDGTNQRLQFSGNNTEDPHLTVYNNGNVGIGTTSPSELLEVSSNTGAADGATNPTTIRISDTDNGSAWDTTNSFANLDFYSADSSGSGAGTKARVGAIAENSTGAQIGLAFSTTNSTDDISEKLRIDASGNVGIGDTTPSYKLDVNGTLRAVGAATFDSNVTIAGNLTVNGTTTTINSTTVQVDDKNIELGTVATPTDTTADGGGITLKGTTDKTINWVNSTDAWTFSERIAIPDGTAAAPALTFTSDTDTGIYRSAANRIGFSAGGGQRAYVDANGITAQGSVYATADFRNYSNVWKASTGVTGNGFEFKNSVDGTALTISSTGDTVASGSVTATSLIKSGGSSSEFLKADGSVDSNTYLTTSSASSTYLPLAGGTMTGALNTGGNAFGGAYLSVSSGGVTQWGASRGVLTWDTGYASIYASSGNELRLGAGGGSDNSIILDGSTVTIDASLIIDTNTSSQPFYITRSGATDQSLKIYVDDQNAIFESIQDETADNYGGFIFNMDAGTTHPFFDIRKNNSTIMRVDGSGNVGIGTTSPSVKLQIQTATSDTTSVEGLRLYNAGGSIGAGVKIGLGVGTTYSEKAYLRTDIISGGAGRLFIGVNGSDRVLIDNGGNVGIGTTNPTYKLETIGSGYFGGVLTTKNTGDSSEVKLVPSGGSPYIQFLRTGTTDWRIKSGGNGSYQILDTSIGGTSVMTVQANGNVGIGTTTPSAKLEVNGHFAATTKSFIVDNPKTGGKLQYGVVESDQHSVFVRGKNDTNTIELPEEWEWLVDEDSVTVQLTSIGQMQNLFVISQDNKTIKIGGLATNGKYNYTVYGERKDVEKLKVNI